MADRIGLSREMGAPQLENPRGVNPGGSVRARASLACRGRMRRHLHDRTRQTTCHAAGTIPRQPFRPSGFRPDFVLHTEQSDHPDNDRGGVVNDDLAGAASDVSGEGHQIADAAHVAKLKTVEA
jgi:hypothetical protein